MLVWFLVHIESRFNPLCLIPGNPYLQILLFDSIGINYAYNLSKSKPLWLK